MESWFALPAEQRFSNLISTLNHDIRNVFLAFIIDGEPKSQGQIRDKFFEITKIPETEYALPTITVKGLCQVIEKYGFLEHLNYGGFILTEAGQQVCRPAAAYAIRVAAQLNRPLYEIFGGTHARSKSGQTNVYTTATLLEILHKEGPQTVLSLARRLELKEKSVTDKLNNLMGLKLVDFASTDTNERGYIKYAWASQQGPEETVPRGDWRAMKHTIAEYLFRNQKWFDQRQLAYELRHVFNRVVDRRRVGKILAELAREGVVKSQHGFSSDAKRSDAKLAIDGTLLCTLYISQLRDAAENSAPTNTMSNALENYLDEQIRREAAQKVSRLCAKSSWQIN